MALEREAYAQTERDALGGVKTIKAPAWVHEAIADLAERHGLTMKAAAFEFFAAAEDTDRPPEAELLDPDDYTDLRDELHERFDRLEAQHGVLEQHHAGILAGQRSNARKLGNEREWVRSVREAASQRELPGDMRAVVDALPAEAGDAEVTDGE